MELTVSLEQLPYFQLQIKVCIARETFLVKTLKIGLQMISF